MATADQLKDKPAEYWTKRLESATWAVVQCQGRVLGIAAAQPPEADHHPVSWGRACFIESVWVDPSMRGRGIGERLVTYLMEQQRQAGIQDFYLWVFDNNEPAIGLYKRMEFKPTGRPSDLVDRHEIQYLRAFDSNLIDDDELARNQAARQQDRDDLGITYRLLTVNSQPHPPKPGRWLAATSMSKYWKASRNDSTCGKPAR